VQIAKHLGAKKVIPTGRNAEGLRSVVALGAHVMTPLVQSETVLEDSLKEQFA
jgi:NADPH:quinone reductase-like Zn-dependent oxidoreductase